MADTANSEQPTDKNKPALPDFAPIVSEPLLFDHNIIRRSSDWHAQMTVRRCVVFTPIGRGFRADSFVVDITDEGPDRLVALLGLTTRIRRNEHLVFDLNEHGQIIGLRDSQASWDRLLEAVQNLRENLSDRIESDQARQAGEKLLDEILATPAGQRDQYLANALLPILGLDRGRTARDGSGAVFSGMGEKLEQPEVQADGIAFTIKTRSSVSDMGRVRTSGHMRISRHDGLLISKEHITETMIGETRRESVDIWKRVTLTADQTAGLCNTK